MIRIDHDLLSMQEARVLVENARDAQKELALFPQEKLDEIVESMAVQARLHARELAEISCTETEYGNSADKYTKNMFVCNFLRNKLQGMQCVGIMQQNDEERTMDIGVPVGVIVALLPPTNPVSTAIYKALIAIKAGNAVVFVAHPRAQKTTAKIAEILIEAAEKAGLPAGAISYLHRVTEKGALEAMNHGDTSMLLATGRPDLLEKAKQTGKPLLYGGPGNGPAFIEKTADIKQAVQDIIASRTFDYGVVSASEQSIVADSCIEAEVRQELRLAGAYFMSREESDKMGSMLLQQDGSLNPELIGKPATFLAHRAGFTVPDDCTVLLSEQKYVSSSNPYSRNRLCPVLAFFVEDDWMHACEKCIELLVSEGKGHTLVIHSKNPEVIREFALKKPVSRVLVNTPATFGGMGATTNLFPALTLGSGAAGGGVTSDNVSPLNLINIRKVGFGVRKWQEDDCTAVPLQNRQPEHKSVNQAVAMPQVGNTPAELDSLPIQPVKFDKDETPELKRALEKILTSMYQG